MKKNRNADNSCYYREMPNFTKKNLIIIKSIIVWKWNHLFTKSYFKKKKINYCYGFMPGDFQVICGSMVGENRRSPYSSETPVFCWHIYSYRHWSDLIKLKKKPKTRPVSHITLIVPFIRSNCCVILGSVEIKWNICLKRAYGSMY